MYMKLHNANIQSVFLFYCVISTTYLLFVHLNDDIHETIRHPQNQRKLLSNDHDIESANDLEIGSIILWGGDISDIPSNWKLCDGTESTPNLTDKFVIGAGNQFAMHSSGGQKDIRLQINQE